MLTICHPFLPSPTLHLISTLFTHPFSPLPHTHNTIQHSLLCLYHIKIPHHVTLTLFSLPHTQSNSRPPSPTHSHDLHHTYPHELTTSNYPHHEPPSSPFSPPHKPPPKRALIGSTYHPLYHILFYSPISLLPVQTLM